MKLVSVSPVSQHLRQTRYKDIPNASFLLGAAGLRDDFLRLPMTLLSREWTDNSEGPSIMGARGRRVGGKFPRSDGHVTYATRATFNLMAASRSLPSALSPSLVRSPWLPAAPHPARGQQLLLRCRLLNPRTSDPALFSLNPTRPNAQPPKPPPATKSQKLDPQELRLLLSNDLRVAKLRLTSRWSFVVVVAPSVRSKIIPPSSSQPTAQEPKA